MKHNERSDQLFFREDDDDGRAGTAKTLNRDEVMKTRRLGSCENFAGK